MSLPSLTDTKALGLLFTLFPGLLTFLVVRLLTGRERKLDAVETVLYGLAYTLVVNVVWAVLCWPGSLIPTPEIVGLGFTSVALGVIVSLANNHRQTYKWLQYFRVTNEPEFETIWETAFRSAPKEIGCFVCLHLKSGNRLMGEVRGFSADRTNGEILLDRYSWLAKPEEQYSETSGWVMIPATDISIIEFINRSRGDTDGVQS